MELDYPKTLDNFCLGKIYCKLISDKGKSVQKSSSEKSICIQLDLPKVLKMMDCT